MQDTSNAIQTEADEIFSLLAYSLVYHNWQYDAVPRDKRRGYNIGALLVNKDNEPVAYDLNCINSTNNATQHGEVRLISAYIDKMKCFNLEGYTMYTTLEPCIMCAGMITMTSVKRVVYGQHDKEYSKAFERLAVDTRLVGGFGPYPRAVMALPSSVHFCAELDTMYSAFLDREQEKILARFLASEPVRAVFKKAEQEFLHYQVRHPENQNLLSNAHTFYSKQQAGKQ